MVSGVARRAGIYVRISKDKFGDKLGVARQEENCRRLAKENGWDVVDVYEENDISAYSGAPRPEWQRLLADIRSGTIDALIAQHPDRFHKGGRDLEDLIDIVRATGCVVDTVNYRHYDLASRSGRTLARINGAVARDESEAKSERYGDKHAELARTGRWHGGPRPYGYEKVLDAVGLPLRDGSLAIVAEEAAIVRETAERVLAGETLYSVCADLNRRCVPTAQNASWRPPTLRRILTAGTHAGFRESRGEVVCEAAWEPILDAKTHRRLRLLLLDDQRMVGRRARVFLLGGYARCGLCSARLIAQRREKGVGVYCCMSPPAGGGCGGVRCVSQPLEALVTEAVLIRLDTPELARAVRTPKSGAEDQVAQAEAELAAARDKLAELDEMWLQQEIDRTQFVHLGKPVRSRVATAERRLKSLLKTERAVPWAGRAGVLREAWPEMNLDQRRAVLGAVVERVVVNRTKIRGRFDPDRVDVIWTA